MTRIFVFCHIIQNSLELKNELQWKKYLVYGGIHRILILTKNRGVFRERTSFLDLLNIVYTLMEYVVCKFYDTFINYHKFTSK